MNHGFAEFQRDCDKGREIGEVVSECSLMTWPEISHSLLAQSWRLRRVELSEPTMLKLQADWLASLTTASS